MSCCLVGRSDWRGSGGWDRVDMVAASVDMMAAAEGFCRDWPPPGLGLGLGLGLLEVGVVEVGSRLPGCVEEVVGIEIGLRDGPSRRRDRLEIGEVLHIFSLVSPGARVSLTFYHGRFQSAYV